MGQIAMTPRARYLNQPLSFGATRRVDLPRVPTGNVNYIVKRCPSQCDPFSWYGVTAIVADPTVSARKRRKKKR